MSNNFYIWFIKDYIYFTDVQHSYNHAYKAHSNTNVKFYNRSRDHRETQDLHEEEWVAIRGKNDKWRDKSGMDLEDIR